MIDINDDIKIVFKTNLSVNGKVIVYEQNKIILQDELNLYIVDNIKENVLFIVKQKQIDANTDNSNNKEKNSTQINLTNKNRLDKKTLAELVEEKAQLDLEEVRSRLSSHEPTYKAIKYGNPIITKRIGVNNNPIKQDTIQTKDGDKKMSNMSKHQFID